MTLGRIALLGLAAGCTPHPSIRDPASSAPGAVERRIALLAFLDLCDVGSGFENRSRRLLLTQQDPDRVDAFERVRLWLPVEGSFLLPELEIGDDGVGLELAVGCEWLDALWPDEGSGALPPSAPAVVQEFALEWVESGRTSPIASRRVRLADGAPDGRTRESWRVTLPRGRGRPQLRTRRIEGAPGDATRLPTLWGPRLVVPAGARARIAGDSGRAADERVVCDLLDPALEAQVAPAPGVDGAPPSADDWRPLGGEMPARSLGELEFPAGEGARRAPFERPLVAVEGHFQAGAALARPRGGLRPALAFAGDAVLRLRLPEPAAAAAAELRFEAAFHEFFELDGGGSARIEVLLDGRSLAALEIAGAPEPAQAGWSETIRVPIAAEATAAAARVLELHVRIDPLDPPRATPAERGASGAPDGQRLRLERPWLGLARPRLVARPDPGRGAPPSDGLSVLFLCVETWRADETGFVGGGSATPRLDRYARRGLVFERATAPAPWTLPSVASYLTGLRPHEHGVVSELADVLPDRCETLAELAGARGVRTFGCVTNGLLRRENGFAAGFERYALWPFATAAQVNELFLGWLDSLGSERFFAYLHYFEPHVPLNAPGSLREGDVAERLRGRPYALAEREVLDALRTAGDASGAPEALEFLRGRYRGEVRHVDREIGALLDQLGRRRGLERTLVIVTGDHGEEFGEHRWYGHGSQLYEESTHVPLLLLGAGVAPGRVEAPVEARLAAAVAAAALGAPDFPAVGAAQPRAARLSADAFEEAFGAAEILCTTEKLIDTWSPGWPASSEGLAARIAARPGRALRVGRSKAIARLPPATAPPGEAAGDDGMRDAVLELIDLERDPGERDGRRVEARAAPAALWRRFEELRREERALRAALPSFGLPAELLDLLRQQGYVDAGMQSR